MVAGTLCGRHHDSQQKQTPEAFSIIKILFCLMAGAVAGVGAIGLGRANDQVGPFTVAISTAPAAQGRTVIDAGALREALNEGAGLLSRFGLDNVVNVPPAGKVSARTHPTPLLVKLTITKVDPQKVRDVLPARAFSVADLLAPLKTRLTATMARLAAQTLAVGGAGGLLLALVLRGKILGALAGVAGGAGAPAFIYALTAATYDLDAFRRPLAAAANLLGLR